MRNAALLIAVVSFPTAAFADDPFADDTTEEPSHVEEPAAPPTFAPPSLTAPTADPLALIGPRPTITRTESYALQIVGLDAAMILGTIATEGDLAVGWLFTGPVVHAIHGHADRAAGSLLARAALPIGGAYLGMQAELSGGCDGEFCGLGGLLLGGAVGILAAEVIDVAIAKDEYEVAAPMQRYGITPVVHARSSDFSLGVAGSF